MAEDEVPNLRDVWEQLQQARMDIAELRGMLTMHFKAGEHHHPSCKPAADMQKTMLSAVGAALLALMAAVGSVIAEILRR